MRPHEFTTLALIYLALIAAAYNLVETHYLVAAVFTFNAYLLARYDKPSPPEDPQP